jgi:hypothetical protein
MFRHVPSPPMPKVEEMSSKLSSQYLSVSRESIYYMESLGKSQKAINIFLQLFFYILDVEKLTKNLRNTINMALRAEGKLEEFIAYNLP